MIYVDSNVPMYLIGAPHIHKTDAQRAVERLIADEVRMVTSAEVFQEILHRYRAIDRADAVQPAFDVLGAIVDDVYDVTRADVEAARDALLGRWNLSSRDALHLAVMRRRDVHRILTFDRAFDTVPGVERLP